MEPAAVNAILEGLASQGPMGLVVLILLYALKRKDDELAEGRRELAALHKERIEDAEQATKLLLDVQTRIIDAVNTLRTLFESERRARAERRSDRP